MLRAYLIFKIISFPVLVTIGKYVLLLLLKAKFPIKFLIKSSIFKQFCGGENEDECKKTIDNLRTSDIYSILDYSVEGLVSNKSFDNTVLRTLNLIKLNTSNNFPFIVFKPTAIGEFKLYEKVSSNKNSNIFDYVHLINKRSKEAFKVIASVLIDAEESWIQASVDEIFENLIVKYNSERTTVYNTVQAYRVDRLNYIKYLQNKFESKKVYIGIKLVRGAYMEKERERSYKLNYASPIHNSKNDTDVCFNDCINYMFEHINLFSIFIGTHNEESSYLLLELAKQHTKRG